MCGICAGIPGKAAIGDVIAADSSWDWQSGKYTDKAWIIKNQKLLESKITLTPYDVKSFTIETNWNGERYFKQDDLEYYLTENDNYEFELTLSLQKDNLKSQLSTEEYQKIEKDPNFLQGDFTSNKVAIYFN